MADYIKRDAERARRIRLYRRASLAASLAFAALSVTLVVTLLVTSRLPETSSGEPSELITRLDQVELLANEQESEIERLQQVLVAAQKDASEFHFGALASQDLESRIESIEGKLKALESALTMDAEKAFSVPLLRKDLETIRQVTNQRLEDLRASIERGAESNRWMIGIAITLALGLVGIVVNLYMQRKGQ